MERTRFTDSQILAVLKQAEAGTAVPDLCREHGISTATFYKWRSKYGGKRHAEAVRHDRA
jgi:putative transposase